MHGVMARHKRGLLSNTVEGGGAVVIGVIDGVECILNLDGSCKEVIGPSPSPSPPSSPAPAPAPPSQPPSPAPQPNNPIPVAPITIPPPVNASPQPNPLPPSNGGPVPAPGPPAGNLPSPGLSPVSAPIVNPPSNANPPSSPGVGVPANGVAATPGGASSPAGQAGAATGPGQGAGQGAIGQVGATGPASGSTSGGAAIGAGAGGAANQAQVPIGVATDIRTLTGDALTSFFSSLSSAAAAAESLTPTSVLGAPLTTTDVAGRTIVVTPTTVGVGPLGPLVIFTTTDADGTPRTVTIASPTPLPPAFRPTQTPNGPGGGDGDGHHGDADGSSGLSTGAVIGIVIACLAAGVACLCLGIFGRRRRQRKAGSAQNKSGRVMASQLSSTPTAQDMPFFGGGFGSGAHSPRSPNLITPIPSSFIHFRESEDLDDPAISPRESLATIRRPEMREAAPSVRSMTASIHTSASGTIREVKTSQESSFKTAVDAPPVPASPGSLLSRLSSRRKPPPPVTPAPFEDLLPLPKPSPRLQRHSSDSEDPFRRSIPVMAPYLAGRGAMLTPTPEPSSVGEDPFEDGQRPRASISSSITALTDSTGEANESTMVMAGRPLIETTPSSREDIFTDAPSHQSSSDEDIRDSVSIYSERELAAFPTARTFGEPTSPYRSHFAEQLLQQRDSVASSTMTDDQRLRADDPTLRPSSQAESATDPYAWASSS